MRLLVTILLVLGVAACAVGPDSKTETASGSGNKNVAQTQTQTKACVVGEGIPYGPDTYSVDNLVVEYGPGVTARMAEIQQTKGGQEKTVYSDYSYELYLAAKANKIERFVGEETHRIYVGNVLDTSKVPDMVPYKSGWGRCAGMAKVNRLGPHALEVTFTLRGGSGFGQGGVVFPREPFKTRNLAVCSTAGVETLFVPKLTAGPLRDLPNTLCSPQYQAGENAINGKPGLLFTFVAAARAPIIKEAAR